MGPMIPRTTISEFRKRRRISIDGQIPGIMYNHYHRSQHAATAPIDQGARAGTPGYMSFHPDAYEPHPGEMDCLEPPYSPYQPETPRHWPDPVRGLAPDMPVEPRQVSYDDCLMTDDLFQQAMQDLLPSAGCLDDGTHDDRGEMPDPVAAVMHEVEALADSPASPGSELGAPHADEIGDPRSALLFADPGDMGLDPRTASLEQLVEGFSAPVLDPQLTLEQQLYEDDLLMRAWMGPGMGPMPPGLGPMGPLGPIF